MIKVLKVLLAIVLLVKYLTLLKYIFIKTLRKLLIKKPCFTTYNSKATSFINLSNLKKSKLLLKLSNSIEIIIK